MTFNNLTLSVRVDVPAVHIAVAVATPIKKASERFPGPSPEC